jgi:hypothetical protein
MPTGMLRLKCLRGKDYCTKGNNVYNSTSPFLLPQGGGRKIYDADINTGRA